MIIDKKIFKKVTLESKKNAMEHWNIFFFFFLPFKSENYKLKMTFFSSL